MNWSDKKKVRSKKRWLNLPIKFITRKWYIEERLKLQSCSQTANWSIFNVCHVLPGGSKYNVYNMTIIRINFQLEYTCPFWYNKHIVILYILFVWNKIYQKGHMHTSNHCIHFCGIFLFSFQFHNDQLLRIMPLQEHKLSWIRETSWSS